MIWRVRDFPKLVPARGDFGPAVRELILGDCLADFPVIERSANEQSREIDAVITSGRVDNFKTVLGAGAFERTLPSFMANPVCVPEHQRKLPSGDAPCVGSACRIWRDSDRLLTRTRFALTRVGQDRWLAYRDGHMRMFSVGFKDHEWEKLSGGVERLVDGTIREYSTVPVAGNDDARVLSYVAGRMDYFASQSGDPGERGDMVAATKEMRQQIDRLSRDLADARALFETLAAERSERAGVCDEMEMSDEARERILGIAKRAVS